MFPDAGTARAIMRAPMDIQRPDQTKAKRKKRIMLIAIGAVALIGITVLLARLKPAVPTVDKNLVWTGEVKRGQMLRCARTPARPFPRTSRGSPRAPRAGSIASCFAPGAIVWMPDSVILTLSNPDVELYAP